ncbi:hypothetical protein BUZ73_11240 [Staphylococcus saprophyticus]|uniref:hypothetical protein n=1 Tax=Staphylococcus saprophyticus TaxID=29385 RepID=UPI000D1DA951|nr:hypothetical protein [Staphylococcus saprophyticus]PTK01886.1 hypothetical protein BUZ73_11240 [Staphylococcus saprophyticus]
MESIYQTFLGLTGIGCFIGLVIIILGYFNYITIKNLLYVEYYIKIMPIIFLLFIISALLYVFE